MAIIILGIIHPILYLKHNVSETVFCLRLQVVSTHLDQIDRDRRQRLALSVGPPEYGGRIQSPKVVF
jgi:hypothetical protein